MEELFKHIDIWNMIVIGVLTSVIVEGFKTMDWFAKRKEITLIAVCLLMTFSNATFVNPSPESARITYWQHLIGNLLIIFSFAMLFYVTVGTWTVQKLFSWIKNKLGAK